MSYEDADFRNKGSQGVDNTIKGAPLSSIIGGFSNHIGQKDLGNGFTGIGVTGVVMIASAGCVAEPGANFSTIISGVSGTVTNGAYHSSIVASRSSIITEGAATSAVIGGGDHSMTGGSSRSVILAGSDSSVYATNDSVLIGSNIFITPNDSMIGANTIYQKSLILGNTKLAFVNGDNTGATGAVTISLDTNVDNKLTLKGDLHVTGTISKSGGTFTIDHPLDDTKILQHSFVESPDMLNIYRGNATLSSVGAVAIELPDYFCALNKDFTYHLTAIGSNGECWISREVDGNFFEITGRPGLKVSWMVTGIRQDKWALDHPIKVVSDKS